MNYNQKEEQNFLSASFYTTKIIAQYGEELFLISYLNSHSINKKTQFSLGKIIIFDESKKAISKYQCDVKSFECLNQLSEWDGKYFMLLRDALKFQKPNFQYEFKTDEDGSNKDKEFKINLILSEEMKVQINILHCKMKYISNENSFIDLSQIMESQSLLQQQNIQKLVNELQIKEQNNILFNDQKTEFKEKKLKENSELLDQFLAKLNRIKTRAKQNKNSLQKLKEQCQGLQNHNKFLEKQQIEKINQIENLSQELKNIQQLKSQQEGNNLNQAQNIEQNHHQTEEIIEIYESSDEY